MRYFLLFILIFVTGLSTAAIYSEQDAGGNVIYSDTPTGNAPKPTTQLQQTPAIPSPTPTAPSAMPLVPVSSPAEHYRIFMIISPKDQETLQNQAIITVQIKLEPDLKPSHQLQLYIDDKPATPPQTNTLFSMQNVERGAHQLSAVILDAKETIFQQSNMLTIYVHRASPHSPTR